MGMPKKMQAKDVPVLPVLKYLLNMKLRADRLKTLMCASYYWKHQGVIEAMPKDTPYKVAKAKMATLINQGFVDGCACGCSGGFTITQKGIDYVTQHVN